MRTILSAVCLLAMAGCSLPERRRPHHDYDYDRHHHRHYRATDDADKNAPEDGTPIPDDLKNPPSETQQSAQPSTTDTLLAKIADQLAQQPTIMHHEFEAMRQSMTAMQTSVDQKLTGVPERVKAEVVKAFDDQPKQPIPPKVEPKSEAKPNASNQSFGIRDPLDDEASESPYGNYTGLVLKVDLRGTRNNADGTLSGERPACVPCVQQFNAFVREAVPEGWTIGFDRSKQIWVKNQPLRRGGLDPTIEIVKDGIVRTSYHGVQSVAKVMREHPYAARSNRGLIPPDAPPAEGDSQYDEWQAWRNRNQSQPNCSAPQAYAAPNCSRPSVQYAAPNCSQLANFGYQQGSPAQSYPVQQFYGGRQVCTPNGCYILPY